MRILTQGIGLLGRKASLALPIGSLLGLALPDLASLLRPFLVAAVIGTLTLALLRLDWSRMGQRLAQPAVPVLLVVWQLVASPLIVWLLTLSLGLSADLQRSLLLQAAAPPIGSAVVFALILGLDGALVVVATVATTLLLPVTLTATVALVLPQAGIGVDLAVFFARVSLLVGAPFVIAWGLRRLIGDARITRNIDLVAGLNILLLVVFAVAIMDGVTARLLQEPIFTAGLLALAFISTALLHLLAWLAFRAAGHGDAFAAALLSGNRNMGLILVITAGTAGPTFSVYCGLVQLPMYCAPLLLTPLVRRAQRCAIQRP